MENIKGILVSIVAPMENHIANGGEKLLGNASSIKKRNDGKVYVSGQMIRHVLFSAIERLNQSDENKGTTYVSNGDGISNKIEVDLRADMGGFMHPSAGSYSGRRTAPLTVTPAVAMGKDGSDITRDLTLRLQRNTKGDNLYSDGYIIKNGEDNKERENAIATKEVSDNDLMLMNFFLDVPALSISKRFTYEGEFHVSSDCVKHVTETERKRRVKLFLEATQSMTDFANQARNAVSGEPQKLLIIFDTKLSRKACRYFEASGKERSNILEELKARNAEYFIGDDTEGDKSVYQAYNEAVAFLNKSTLSDPNNGEANIKDFADAFTVK